MECWDASRHSVHTMETHTGEICTSCWTKHVLHGENDRCSWTDDSCRTCSTGQGNHSAECRQRFEKIQYDLLQEKLRQAPIIPEDSGEQTVVTPAPAASEAEPGVTESSSAPSASERIRQKRGGLHGPEHPDVSESVQTNVSSPDVAMGNAVSPAPASSSGQSRPVRRG